MEKKRIEWIDVARCIGIYMVFIGHFGAAVGRTQPFVFEFHVPLFFSWLVVQRISKNH